MAELAALGLWLDSMISKAFFNLIDSVILLACLDRTATISLGILIHVIKWNYSSVLSTLSPHTTWIEILDVRVLPLPGLFPCFGSGMI